MRELERKLPAAVNADDLVLFKKILLQKRSDSNKIYSLHEPHVQCISKGKEHKKYEFGSKVSIITTKKSGVIIGALNIPKNDYDAHTVDPAFVQQQRLTGITLKRAFMDRGFKGISEVRGTKIEIPKPFNKALNGYQQDQLKKGFKRRAALEPKIGHLKEDHRLSRNFYKGIKGDDINVMLAAAAMNFKRMMNIYKKMFLAFIYRMLQIFIQPLISQNFYPSVMQ